MISLSPAARRWRNLIFMARPRLWVNWPFLPLVRRCDNGSRQLGVMYDARGVSGIYGFSATVLLSNLFTLPRTEAQLLALPKCVYDTLDEVIAAGWRVD
jgi:hypothetical protein